VKFCSIRQRFNIAKRESCTWKNGILCGNWAPLMSTICPQYLPHQPGWTNCNALGSYWGDVCLECSLAVLSEVLLGFPELFVRRMLGQYPDHTMTTFLQFFSYPAVQCCTVCILSESLYNPQNEMKYLPALS
jgi:hypothetical protein